MSILRVAIAQHPLSGAITVNLEIVKKQIQIAAKSGADIVLFPECNLTGYAGIEFTEYSEDNRLIFEQAMEEVKRLASELKIWLIVGGYFFEGGQDLPYNSLFVINTEGEIKCRYDKRLLTAGDSGNDIKYFTSGSGPVTFYLKGIKCALLICHEWRYPELYREYKGLGVDLIFQSWYDASVDPDEYKKSGRDHGSLIMGAIRSNAANNYLWICGSNASNRESSLGSFLVCPDGIVKAKLARNRAGVLFADIDTSRKFIDPSAHNRERFL